MCNVIYRRGSIEDVQDLYEIEKLCFHDPWSLQSLTEEFTLNDRAFYVVAELCGKVIGYVGLWQMFDEGHITNVAVRPEHRQKHIGNKLLTTMIEMTKNQGILHHTLEVRPSNEPAISLYEKKGFKVEGRRKAYYQDNGEDALIMWRHDE